MSFAASVGRMPASTLVTSDGHVIAGQASDRTSRPSYSPPAPSHSARLPFSARVGHAGSHRIPSFSPAYCATPSPLPVYAPSPLLPAYISPPRLRYGVAPISTNTTYCHSRVSGWEVLGRVLMISVIATVVVGILGVFFALLL